MDFSSSSNRRDESERCVEVVANTSNITNRMLKKNKNKTLVRNEKIRVLLGFKWPTCSDMKCNQKTTRDDAFSKQKGNPYVNLVLFTK